MPEPGDLPTGAANASEFVAQAIPQAPPKAKLNLLDIHPLKLAQQISLLDHDLCKDVLLTDIESRRAEGPNAARRDSISPCIKFSNHLACWVAHSILEPEDTSRRGALIEFFISIAQNVRGMNNLSSMTAILAGLHSPHVFRLRGSWKLVSKGKVDDMISCLHTSDVRDRFLNPFVTLACLEPPGVPFIGNFLVIRGETDAYFDSLITRAFTRWQSTSYPFEVDNDIRAFIQEGLSQFAGPNGNDPDPTDLFEKLSLDREPEKSEEQGALKKIFKAPSRWFQRLQ